MKNTVELVNAKEESILKVCFDSPLSSASWIADFKKAREEIDNINKFQEGKKKGKCKVTILHRKSNGKST